MNLRNTLFTLICLLWVEISWKTSGLGASEQKKVRGNYVCCLVIVVIFMRPGGAKRQDVFKNITRREEEKPQTRGTVIGCHKKTTREVDQRTTLSGITYYFSLLWCKKIYALLKIPSLLKPHKESLNQFFLLDLFLFTLLISFSKLQMTTE